MPSKSTFCLLTALCFFSAAGLTPTVAADSLDLPEIEECDATLAGVVGSAEIQKKGKPAWEKAESEACLEIGDRVRTGAESAASIEYGDRTVLSLNALALVTVEKSASETRAPDTLFLERGQVYAETQKLNAAQFGSFTVRTPTAAAGVRGTAFDVEVDEDGASSVSVIEGEVELSNDQGSRRVGAGFRSLIKKGLPPGALNEFDIEKHRGLLDKWRGKIRDIQMLRKKMVEKKQEIKQEAEKLKDQWRQAKTPEQKRLVQQKAKKLKEEAAELKSQEVKIKKGVKEAVKEAKEKPKAPPPAGKMKKDKGKR